MPDSHCNPQCSWAVMVVVHCGCGLSTWMFNVPHSSFIIPHLLFVIIVICHLSLTCCPSPIHHLSPIHCCHGSFIVCGGLGSSCQLFVIPLFVVGHQVAIATSAQNPLPPCEQSLVGQRGAQTTWGSVGHRAGAMSIGRAITDS